MYFDLLEVTLGENQLVDKSGQIYNMDKTGLPLDPRPPRTAHVKGTNKALLCTGSSKSQITAVGYVQLASLCYQ